jgi:hypothetical protein
MNSAFRCAVMSIALSALFGCSAKPPEQALRDSLDALETAGESRQVGAFMAMVANDFSGNEGEFDKPGLARLLQLVALQNQSINVVREPAEITIENDKATVKMAIIVTGGSGGFLPERGQWFDTTSNWRQQGRAWQLVRATWQPRL